MVLSILFAHIWGVAQLALCGSFGRTVRLATILVAVGVGTYACAPIALLLQVASTIVLSRFVEPYAAIRTAGYTIDPFIEEVVKVAPLFGLMAIGKIRRQWSFTDCVLIGAACGAGFGLAEDVARYGSEATRAVRGEEGWTLATSIALPFVPDVQTSLASWLPSPTASGDEFFPGVEGHPWVSHHLIWSAVGGLSVACVRLSYGRATRLFGIFLLFFVGADHAASNAAGTYDSWVNETLAPVFLVSRAWMPFWPLGALAMAWSLGRRRRSAALGSEATLVPACTTTDLVRLAVARVPLSAFGVSAFVRHRRALANQRASGDEAAALQSAVDRLRQLLRWMAHQPAASLRFSSAIALRQLRKRLLRPGHAIWLATMILPALWFILGGYPQTAHIQTTLASGWGRPLSLALAIAAQTWLIWSLRVRIQACRRIALSPLGEPLAMLALQSLTAAGAVCVGSYALLQVLAGSDWDGRMFAFHIIEAVNRITGGAGAAGAAGAGGFVPPRDGAMDWGEPPKSPRSPGEPGSGDVSSPGDGGGVLGEPPPQFAMMLGGSARAGGAGIVLEGENLAGVAGEFGPYGLLLGGAVGVGWVIYQGPSLAEFAGDGIDRIGAEDVGEGTLPGGAGAQGESDAGIDAFEKKKLEGLVDQVAEGLARLLNRQVGGKSPDHQEDPKGFNEIHWWHEVKTMLSQVTKRGLTPKQLARALEAHFSAAEIAEIRAALVEAARLMGEAVPESFTL